MRGELASVGERRPASSRRPGSSQAQVGRGRLGRPDLEDADDCRPRPAGGRSGRAEALRGLCGGAVHLPGDAAFDEARLPWNLSVDARPAAVAYPAFPSEVADVVRTAASVGLRVAPQGTGHGAPPLAGRLEDAVLLRTSAMTELRVDAERRTARVGAGVRWGDVVERAGAVGLAARHTSSPGVGVVGSSLGGGLSWYARAAGLQCSALTAVELVLADGTLVRATDTDHSDLMWAARGGAGGFAVVTALEFDLLPIARVHAGMLAWDWAYAEPVLSAWSAMVRRGARERHQHRPAVPGPRRAVAARRRPGTPPGLIDAVMLEDSERAAALLAPLRALRPEIDTFADVPAASVARLQLDPEAPTAVYAHSVLVSELPEQAVEALVAAAGPGSGSELLFIEIRQLGGALSRPGRPSRCAGPDGRRVPGARRGAGHRCRLGGGPGGRASRDGVGGAVDEPVRVPPDGRRAGRRPPGLAGGVLAAAGGGAAIGRPARAVPAAAPWVRAVEAGVHHRG